MTPTSDVNRGDWLTALAALAFVLVTRANGEFLALIVIFFIFAMRKMQVRQGVALLILVVLIFGAANSWRARQELRDVTTGSYAGIAKVMSDPRNVGYATRIVLEIERDRFVIYAYGSPAWRLAGARVGEQVFVRGYREDIRTRQRIALDFATCEGSISSRICCRAKICRITTFAQCSKGARFSQHVCQQFQF